MKNDLDVMDLAFARLCLAIFMRAQWDLKRGGGELRAEAREFLSGDGGYYDMYVTMLGVCFPGVNVERRHDVFN